MTTPAHASELTCVHNKFDKVAQEQHVAPEIPPDKMVSAITTTDEADNNTSCLTDGGRASEIPSRASFLGLPAEMRLRIYDYLLDVSRRPDAKDDSKRSGNCCFWDLHCCWKYLPEGRLKCNCAKSVYPSILRVNKLINHEATPILYASLELRVDVPREVLETGNSYDHCALWTLLRSSFAPTHHRIDYSSSLVFATAMNSLPICITDDEAYVDQLKPLWSRLSAPPLNIKNFRLYVRFDGIHDDHLDYDELLGFLTLPRLQMLAIEVFIPNPDGISMDADDLEAALPFLEELKKRAKYKINELGRNIGVTGLLRREDVFHEVFGENENTDEDVAANGDGLSDDNAVTDDETAADEDAETSPADYTVATQGIDLGPGGKSGEEEEEGMSSEMKASSAKSSNSAEGVASSSFPWISAKGP